MTLSLTAAATPGSTSRWLPPNCRPAGLPWSPTPSDQISGQPRAVHQLRSVSPWSVPKSSGKEPTMNLTPVGNSMVPATSPSQMNCHDSPTFGSTLPQ